MARVPGTRLLVALGLILIPAFWFTVPALTAHSWFIAGELDLHQATAIHGNKILGVIHRFGSLYPLPIQIMALWGLILAGVRRDRVTLAVAAAAVLWVMVEIAFALHGWSAVPRFLLEPAAVMMALAAATAGRLLVGLDRRDLHPRRAVAASRVIGPVAVAALVVAVWPTARSRERDTRSDIAEARVHARQVERLHAVVVRIGGPARIRSCGQPVSFVGFQSTLAYDVGLNVGNVGYRPGQMIHDGQAIVFFKPDRLGWRVRTYNLRRGRRARVCRRLRADTSFG